VAGSLTGGDHRHPIQPISRGRQVGFIGHQLLVTEFLQPENRLLRDRLRGRRICFTVAERATLARHVATHHRHALP
jgi:hypothetical protein